MNYFTKPDLALYKTNTLSVREVKGLEELLRGDSCAIQMLSNTTADRQLLPSNCIHEKRKNSIQIAVCSLYCFRSRYLLFAFNICFAFYACCRPGPRMFGARVCPRVGLSWTGSECLINIVCLALRRCNFRSTKLERTEALADYNQTCIFRPTWARAWTTCPLTLLLWHRIGPLDIWLLCFSSPCYCYCSSWALAPGHGAAASKLNIETMAGSHSTSECMASI